jgi:pimeloyl-ACP methyl ester carboxylesterase
VRLIRDRGRRTRAARVRRAIERALAPAEVGRLTALTRMERIAAVTHIVASLEYLARPRDRRRGGLNNWAISGAALHARSPRLARMLDLVADRRTTTALHGLRVPIALSLFARTPRAARLAADAALAGTSAALYPRQHYGTDGSDQVSFLVQGIAGVARAAQRNPRVVDACLWYAALQATLSYTVSGWAKLAGPSWRSGDALTGVTRTLTYGDPTAWRLFNRFPRIARLLGTSVVAMECTFPMVFAGRGRLAPLMLSWATAFHLGNARIMGLGRFVWAFESMHPAVLYAAGPRERTDARGRVVERRDDTMPKVAAGATAGALTGALLAQANRRSVVLAGRGDERRLTARSGNELAYRRLGADNAGEPAIVLESGLIATAEHWEWIARGLAERFPTVTYCRAGYGPSAYRARGPYTLAVAVADLADLVRHVGGARPVIVIGHSLGGWLALRAADAAPEHVAAVGLLDSSHPAETQRSSRQAQGQEVLSSSLALMPASLSLGLGALLERPDWVDSLPEGVRRLALAQYRDPRLWAAGRREWRATVTEFGVFDGRLPRIGVPLLVMTAGLTAANDPVQLQLHRELADAAPAADVRVLEGADHDQVLTHPRAARRVVDMVGAFADGLPNETQEVTVDAQPAR